MCTGAFASNTYKYATYSNGEPIKHFNVIRDDKRTVFYIRTILMFFFII